MDEKMMGRELKKSNKSIEEIPLDILETISGGSGAREVKCPICHRICPVREIKAHITSAHSGQ